MLYIECSNYIQFLPGSKSSGICGIPSFFKKALWVPAESAIMFSCYNIICMHVAMSGLTVQAYDSGPFSSLQDLKGNPGTYMCARASAPRETVYRRYAEHPWSWV